jgi:hypothetical protein
LKWFEEEERNVIEFFIAKSSNSQSCFLHRNVASIFHYREEQTLKNSPHKTIQQQQSLDSSAPPILKKNPRLLKNKDGHPYTSLVSRIICQQNSIL